MRAASVLVAAVYFALLLIAYAADYDARSVGGLRGWWNDRLTVWRLRREWRRRKRAQQAAQRALNLSAPIIPGYRFRPDWRKVRRIALYLGIGVGVVFMLAFAHGCGGRYPIDDGPQSPAGPDAAAATDAGANAPAEAGAENIAADARVPQCQDLQPGEEFFAADIGDALPQLILNDQNCMRFCRNTAGGATCVSASNELVHCAACQGNAP